MMSVPAPQCPTILIADDHVLVREGMKVLINGLLGSTQFIETADGDSLLAAAASRCVHLALVDVKIPRMQSGLRLAELSRRHPQIPLVIVSSLDSPDTVRRILQVPTVFAFVHKAAHHAQLRAAVEAGLQRKKLPYVLPSSAAAPPPSPLTPRQQQIRELLRQGFSNKLIASMLGISEGTVKNRISEIFKALNATNRTQVALPDREVRDRDGE